MSAARHSSIIPVMHLLFLLLIRLAETSHRKLRCDIIGDGTICFRSTTYNLGITFAFVIRGTSIKKKGLGRRELRKEIIKAPLSLIAYALPLTAYCLGTPGVVLLVFSI
jgi:hypothetical protein